LGRPAGARPNRRPRRPWCHRAKILIHDCDSKFSHAFDEVFRSEATIIVRTPLQTPNANAHAERWVRTVRNDCLDRVLVLGCRQLEHVLRVYVRRYNADRPHRSLDLHPPIATATSFRSTSRRPPATIQRRDLLGGLLHEYALAA
jgi:putative transposase